MVYRPIFEIIRCYSDKDIETPPPSKKKKKKFNIMCEITDTVYIAQQLVYHLKKRLIKD